ncbi:hypothetical protein V494_01297 [Pseudogymnoascus sp. VKM F-4513 (FW-928)]|nr:hypothetical protein V494_01297 [Pseudogymnoascus sp. VKM F-4513 (FW-928)]
MDSHGLNTPFDLSAFLAADFQGDGPSMDTASSSEFTAPFTASSNIGGRYQLNGASLFDPDYIVPAFPEAHNSVATNNFRFLDDYCSPAIQHTQNDLSPFHPEWHAPAADFEEQQQNLRGQQGVPDGVFPNALDTSPYDGSGFDWPGAWQGAQRSLGPLNHIANGPTSNLAFSQTEETDHSK